jgi:hypothetical protein
MDKTVADAGQRTHTWRAAKYNLRGDKPGVVDGSEGTLKSTPPEMQEHGDELIGEHGFNIPERNVQDHDVDTPATTFPTQPSDDNSSKRGEGKHGMSYSRLIDSVGPGTPQAVQFGATVVTEPALPSDTNDDEKITSKSSKSAESDGEHVGQTLLDPDLKKQLEDVSRTIEHAMAKMRIMKDTRAPKSLRNNQNQLIRRLYNRKDMLINLINEIEEQEKLEKAQAEVLTETWITEWQEAKMQGFEEESTQNHTNALTALLEVSGTDPVEIAELREVDRLIRAITVGELKWQDYSDEMRILPNNTDSLELMLRWMTIRRILNLVYCSAVHLQKVHEAWAKLIRFKRDGEADGEMNEPSVYGDIGMQGNPPLNYIDGTELFGYTLEEIERRGISEGAITRTKILGSDKLNEWLTLNPDKHLIDYLQFMEDSRRHDMSRATETGPSDIEMAMDGCEMGETFEERVEWQQEHNLSLALGEVPMHADQGIRWDLLTGQPYSAWADSEVAAYLSQHQQAQTAQTKRKGKERDTGAEAGPSWSRIVDGQAKNGSNKNRSDRNGPADSPPSRDDASHMPPSRGMAPSPPGSGRGSGQGGDGQPPRKQPPGRSGNGGQPPRRPPNGGDDGDDPPSDDTETIHSRIPTSKPPSNRPPSHHPIKQQTTSPSIRVLSNRPSSQHANGFGDVPWMMNQPMMYGDEGFFTRETQPSRKWGAVTREYLDRAAAKYKVQIERAIGDLVCANTEGAKYAVVKVADVDKWNGSRDLIKWETFITRFCRWMRINHLGGPHREQERISHLGYHLTGDAEVWFTNNVDGPNATMTWSLIGIIMGLFLQYVAPTAIQQASDFFLRIKFGSTVFDFYTRLAMAANMMVERPDPYTFKQRFLVGLPNHLRDFVLERNHNAEHSSMSELFAQSEDAELATQNKKRYNAMGHPSSMTNAGHSGGGQRNTTTPPRQSRSGSNPPRHSSQPVRFTSQPRSMTPGVRFYRPMRRGSSAPRGTAPPFNRNSQIPRSSPVAVPAAHNPREATQQRAMSDKNVGRRVSDNKERYRCRACGKMGHWSKDPECEFNKGKPKPKLFHTRPIEEPEPEEVDAELLQTLTEEEQVAEAEAYLARVSSPVDAWEIEEPEGETIEEPDDFIEEEDYPEGEVEGERYGGMFMSITPDADSSYDEYESSSEDAQAYNAMFAQLEVEEDGSDDDWGHTFVPGPNLRSIQTERFHRAFSEQPRVQVAYGLVRPSRTIQENRPIVCLTKINKFLALTLIDTACTTEAVSPEFARIAGVKPEVLDVSIPLQLGTAGSKSVINYGFFADWEIGDYKFKNHYFDVINLDRYDAVMGTVAMRKYEVIPLLHEDAVIVGGLNGTKYEALSEGEEKAVVARRYAIRQSNRPMRAHLKPTNIDF